VLRPEVLKAYREQGRLSLPGAVLAEVSRHPLPSSVRLMDRLFPVRDQGERGTCVAFSAVALREYLDGCSTELSEQFLYWACKQLDGSPDTPGTYLSSALSALNTQGVCTRTTLPYCAEVIPGDEAQGPPPSEAFDEARGYRMANSRTVAANCVNHYKHVLAGTDGAPGMPVIIASLVFNSWYRSAATHQSGKITLPLPGEAPLPGGHAMLLVGYQDDPSVPGGGYFIVRNSWSDRWAARSPEAPGHALMPYAYVERCVVEAFTGAGQSSEPRLVGSSATSSASAGAPFERYLDTLRRDSRDIEGKLLRAGTRVIRAPDAPDEVMQDTPAHRRRFESLGFVWSETARRAAWFPTGSEWDAVFRSLMQTARQRGEQFRAALSTNLKGAAGRPLPDIRWPFWAYGVPILPHTRRVALAADLSKALAEEVVRWGQVPEGIAPPEDWRGELEAVNRLEIYTVGGWLGTFHVVSACMTPLRFVHRGTPQQVPADATLVDAVRRLYTQWADGRPKPMMTFLTLGSTDGWATGMTALAGASVWTLLSSVNETGRWRTAIPPQFAAKRYLRDFIDRLHPETEQDRIVRVKNAVDEHLHTGYAGNLLVDKIAAETGERRTGVIRAFRAMQESGHYECYRVEKKIAIRPDTGKGGITLPKERSFMLRYHLLPLVLGVLGPLSWTLAGYMSTGVFDWVQMSWVLILSCAFKSFENVVKRNQTDL
jgi:hypothetical protein